MEFGDLLQYEDLHDNGKLFIIPNNLPKLGLAREVAQLSRELKKGVSSGIQEIQKTSLKDLVLRMGVFHTACTFLSIIEKRFQDAGLRDLAVESGVVAEGSISGGMDGCRKGFSLKPGAVNKYYLIAEYRSMFMRQLKDMLHVSTLKSKLSDFQPSRIAKDEADVKSLVSIVDGSWINPFLGSQRDPVCLSSGKLATP